MSKPASQDVLADLHSGFAAYLLSLLNRAVQSMEPSNDLEAFCMPLDAATMGVIARFLKDNSITTDPAEQETLNKLREQYSRAKQGVSGDAAAAVQAAIEDADVSGLSMQ